MGKIRVQDLARMMSISNQDLVFKLKSIGVRVEGDDAHIDSEILQAIIQGKKLPHPREVILRDEPAPAEVQRKRTQAPPPVAARRPMVNPLRPGRPRTLIQKVEPRIQTLPASERPERALTAAAAAAAEAQALLPAEVVETPREAPVVAAPQAAPAATAPVAAAPVSPPVPAPPAPPIGRPVGTAPSATGAQRPSNPVFRDTGTRPRPTSPVGPRPETPSRPGAPSPSRSDRPSDRDRRGAKKPKGKVPPRIAPDPNLTVFKGSLKDLEEDEDISPSARRSRRAQRREDENIQADGGKLLSFRKAPPVGTVTISEGMTLREFADKLGVKAKDLIKALFDRGILANINSVVEPQLAQAVAKSLGVETMIVSFEEEVQLREEIKRGESETTGPGREPRGPVVTIMGHVDHGKTSLLDAIRKSKVTESEFGGITQHIGAYHVDVRDRKIVFLDTPGHEAFTMMRARGAKVTDIVVLVVAADDGVMPQTVEAIDHARAAKVPMVVAINKVDKVNANPDRVKRELADRGLQPEEWGGDTVMVGVSALKKEGIDELLEMILLTADLLDLKADSAVRAQGAVLEARKEVGRGIVATVLVQNGTLKPGDLFVTGATWGRVRSMTDDLDRRIQAAGPSTPVGVTGFTDLPGAGDPFQVVEDEVKARGIAEFRALEERQKGLLPVQRALSLEQLFGRIQAGDVKELPVVLKADVQGSLEVLRDSLLKASTEKVKVQVILSGLGAISTNDVLLASASRAIIIGFNVRPERSAAELAEKEGIDIRLHTVIYELLDELKLAMVGLLDPTFREVSAGRAEVRDTFKVPKVGTIAGCHVVEGVIPRNALVRLLRDNRVVFEGKISSLRRFKDDVAEVRTGFDCGIGLERFQDFKPGDVIEAYGREEVAATL